MSHVFELIWKILEKTQTNFPAKILKNARYHKACKQGKNLDTLKCAIQAFAPTRVHATRILPMK